MAIYSTRMLYMGIDRTLQLGSLLEKKSFFLFGPRSTGKTTLLRDQLSGRALFIDLLKSQTRIRLLSRPQDLGSMIQAGDHPSQWIIIDEIQKVPDLLDEVHSLIEDGFRFLLTGSSARKLMRTSANLLGGRARVTHLFPLTSHELKERFELERYLLWGGLPSIYFSNEPNEDLIAYADVYLREEIEQEAQVRNLGAFTRFLKGAAIQNGQLLNFAAVASDAMVSESTVRNYYQILKDTLIGDFLEPWRESKKRKAVSTVKFYFFDPGVVHALREVRDLPRNSELFGSAFEQLIYMELRAYLGYRRKHLPLRFWRSINGQEVDFLIDDQVAIEAKATERVLPRHLAGLRALREERQFKSMIVVSQDPQESLHGDIRCLHWRAFFERLWGDQFF